MKQIRYAHVTLKLVIPVYSYTAEEAAAIAQDSVEDIVTNWEGEDFAQALTLDTVSTTRPNGLPGDLLVWGSAVPEDYCRVDELIQHLA